MGISQLIWLLLIGYIVFSIDKKQENFPVPTILVGIGVGLAFLPIFDQINVSDKMIYEYMLPPLLFISAYQFPIAAFRKNAKTIIFLATIGLITTVAILGGFVYLSSFLFTPISFLAALVLASMLTPTDPVSVVSIMKKSSGNEKQAHIVEGESMLNDGTSIVIFSVLAGMLTNQETFSVLSFFGEFFYVSLGGILVGILLGFITSKIVHYSHNREYQVMLSVIVAYGSFMLAEHFHVSGVLATVSVGLMLSFEHGRAIKEDHFRDSLDGFWGIIELSILGLLFLLIGIEAKDYLFFNGWLFAFLIFAFTIIIRFAIILGTMHTFSHASAKSSWKESGILTWAGLKGSMSIFLILSLQVKENGNEEISWIISVAFVVVLLSLFLQSLTLSPLSKSLFRNK
ncbi:cation:proton antiporter [Saliterribacillus persicus]|uniref:Sodium/proton antiporter (CPA1 family) n=1 Tax=Saliterribacillus persicus TaxID=930114 RepID=A0A368XZQ1_9BACI|nr:sodium:proton antiporter [Saliterribacillus persicus]RCW72037.1 sodium/proton antiporter (CPA1 family) [Saliterribacillus persicus]